jgi:hypothetical protein
VQVNNAVQAVNKLISSTTLDSWNALDHVFSQQVAAFAAGAGSKNYFKKMHESVESLKTDGLSGVGKAAFDNVISMLKVRTEGEMDVQNLPSFWAEGAQCGN